MIGDAAQDGRSPALRQAQQRSVIDARQLEAPSLSAVWSYQVSWAGVFLYADVFTQRSHAADQSRRRIRILMQAIRI